MPNDVLLHIAEVFVSAVLLSPVEQLLFYVLHRNCRLTVVTSLFSPVSLEKHQHYCHEGIGTSTHCAHVIGQQPAVRGN